MEFDGWNSLSTEEHEACLRAIIELQLSTSCMTRSEVNSSRCHERIPKILLKEGKVQIWGGALIPVSLLNERAVAKATWLTNDPHNLLLAGLWPGANSHHGAERKERRKDGPIRATSRRHSLLKCISQAPTKTLTRWLINTWIIVCVRSHQFASASKYNGLSEAWCSICNLFVVHIYIHIHMKRQNIKWYRTKACSDDSKW